MRTTLLTFSAAVLLLLAGCKDKEAEEQLAKARTDLALAEAQTRSQHTEIQRLDTDLRALRTELSEARRRLADAQQEADAAAAATQPDAAEMQRLRQRVSELEGETRRLDGELAAAKATGEKTADKPADNPGTKPADPEAIKLAADLLTRLKANPGNQDTVEELSKALHKADAATREKAVSELKALVTTEPQNKEARLALASVMAIRFRDLRNPMDQGKLAGDIKTELDKALEIDPAYYDAQHFMAIMKVNYPPFTDEFKTANKDLDRALELQAGLPWEDEFGEIYQAYSGWYRTQGMLDEATAKVQAGLDKAPRHDGLLAEKKNVDDAKAAKNAPKEE